MIDEAQRRHLLAECAAAQARYEQALADLDAVRARRDERIRELVADGVPVQAVARALGISRARAYQVLDR